MSFASSSSTLEGVFAISKPGGLTSARAIDHVKRHFDASRLFQPWISREKARLAAESHNQKRKRKWRGNREVGVKVGHGGTLDPMATGVLVLGIGSGTKQLNHFTTDCVKSYDTVVLFGAASDTYDTEGEVVSRAPYEHITQAAVESALLRFNGKIMQKPPIFSALRVQGKRMYEYAREGKELPIEIQERPVEVLKMELVEWMDGGSHQWQWPAREAAKETKEVAEKALRSIANGDVDGSTSTKRKRSEDAAEVVSEPVETPSSKKPKAEAELVSEESKAADADSADLVKLDATDGVAVEPKKAEPADEVPVDAVKEEAADTRPDDRPPCPAPACRIRMTVTSGFYVRSLCHDLGTAVGSRGLMTSLVRTQQGDFELDKNVLTYDDLQLGEDVWGPKVQQMLQDWTPVVDKKANKA